jgi:peptidoglycan/LPS O-acetylase OafA/YrhL
LAIISKFGIAGDQLTFFVASIVLGVIISHLIERPFLRLRAKWLPVTRRSAPAEDHAHVVLVDPLPSGRIP